MLFNGRVKQLFSWERHFLVLYCIVTVVVQLYKYDGSLFVVDSIMRCHSDWISVSLTKKENWLKEMWITTWMFTIFRRFFPSFSPKTKRAISYFPIFVSSFLTGLIEAHIAWGNGWEKNKIDRSSEKIHEPFSSWNFLVVPYSFVY
jgi:hypothetical protein